MDSIYEGTFRRGDITRAVDHYAHMANGEVRVTFHQWRDREAGPPIEETVSGAEWRRWAAWADRDHQAPRCEPPIFVDCPTCAFRLTRDQGFGPGDDVGCPKCKLVFTVHVEALAVGVKR